MVVPQNGWFIMENPFKMDALGVPPFKETPICTNQAFDDHCSIATSDELPYSLLCTLPVELRTGIAMLKMELRNTSVRMPL